VARLTSAVIVLLLAAAAWAQSSADPVHISPLDKIPGLASRSQVLTLYTRPLQVDVNMVLVPVTVTDPMNRPVTGLEQENFVLFEGKQRQQIEFFAREDGPISIGVLLDLSKSMLDKIDMAKRAIAEFFATAHPDDDYFVITFADRPALLADASESLGTIQARLANAVAGGHTALLDAIYLGENELGQARYKRRALLIISDGGDNRSRFTARELKSMVEEEDATVYAIGLFDKVFKSPEEWAGKRLLTQITEATGGRTVTLSNPKDLPQAASEISVEMRNQYILGYRPSNVARDGKWRKIKVRVSLPAKTAQLQVYSKSGYRAPVE
jgi:Ca-activated chloride channel family protein